MCSKETSKVKLYIVTVFIILLYLLKGMLQYQINDSSLKWSFMFDVLERNASELGISNYSLSQTTLEQVCPIFF